MWNVVAYLSLLVATAVYAFARGGAPERIAAAIILAAVVLTIVAGSHVGRVFGRRETTILAVDIAMFVAVVALALCANRYWPIWMAAILGLGLELQFVMWVAPANHLAIYKVLHFWDAYPTLLLLVLGTRRHRLRVARHGADAPWSDFSNRWRLRNRRGSPND